VGTARKSSGCQGEGGRCSVVTKTVTVMGTAWKRRRVERRISVGTPLPKGGGPCCDCRGASEWERAPNRFLAFEAQLSLNYEGLWLLKFDRWCPSQRWRRRGEEAFRPRCNSLLVLRLAHHEAAATAADPGSCGQRPFMDVVVWGAPSPVRAFVLAITP